MSDRITTTCQHSHTVTLRLDEGEVPTESREPWVEARIDRSGIGLRREGRTKWSRFAAVPLKLRAELEAALAAAEASCGGCGCAERLRAEAERLAREDSARFQQRNTEPELLLLIERQVYTRAADFLDAAQDARGSDLSAEQPATVSEQGHAKKRAEWNDPKGGRVIPDGFMEAFQKVSDDLSKFLDQEASDG